jgi:hypothetical protein
MHRRHGWGWATITFLLAFLFGYFAIANGNDQGAAAPSWFVDMTYLLALVTAVSLVTVIVYSARLRRTPLAILEQASPIAARHRHGPHTRHYPPRHAVTWTARWIGMLVILFMAVISVPALVDATAYLAGAEKTVTFDPVSHQTNCDHYSCQTFTDGVLETGGAGMSVSWSAVVPLGKPFPVREPVWKWGLGLSLINSDKTAIIALVVTLLIDATGVLVLINIFRLARNWRQRRREPPTPIPSASAA